MGIHVRYSFIRWFSAICMVSLALATAARAEDAPEIKALKKASVEGKYTKLLAVIHVPNDKTDYGEFSDYGLFEGTEWAGYKGLPTGYWVYVYPHWYIWEKDGK
jgi:hypothetical protein